MSKALVVDGVYVVHDAAYDVPGDSGCYTFLQQMAHLALSEV